MKTARDPRHQHRIDRMQKLFAVSFENPNVDPDIADIVTNLTQLDQQILASAPEWPLNKIAKVDLAILRLAAYELTVEKTEPQKVIIDEAVEIAKAYGNPNSPAFINGALGALVKTIPA